MLEIPIFNCASAEFCRLLTHLGIEPIYWEISIRYCTVHVHAIKTLIGSVFLEIATVNISSYKSSKVYIFFKILRYLMSSLLSFLLLLSFCLLLSFLFVIFFNIRKASLFSCPACVCAKILNAYCHTIIILPLDRTSQKKSLSTFQR